MVRVFVLRSSSIQAECTWPVSRFSRLVLRSFPSEPCIRVRVRAAMQAWHHGGALRGCAPPSEDCAPKKLTGSGLLECKSRPKTPKLLFTTLELASKNCFFVVFVDSRRISLNFWDEDFFIWSLSFLLDSHLNKLLVPPSNSHK